MNDNRGMDGEDEGYERRREKMSGEEYREYHERLDKALNDMKERWEQEKKHG